VVATVAHHLGHELQQSAVAAGYDEDAEEELLAGVDWSADGYRLFDVSVPAASSRGWFTPPAESNALFLPRELWDELGGYDEDFSSPGGGLVNLDTFERACRLPHVEVVLLLGESTFHQVHGGVSTNSPESRYAEWRADYERLRGRPYRRPDVPVLSVGTPPPQVVAGLAGDDAGPRLGRRYVELLKAALLNETALEAEAAFFMARDELDAGGEFDDLVAYDVQDRAPEYFERLAHDRAEGRYFQRDKRRIGFGYTMIGRGRLDDLDWCVSTVLDDGVPGDLVECGVWRGGASILMRGILASREVTERLVWVADSFTGLPKPESPRDTLDLSAGRRPELAVSPDRVAANFARFDLLDDQVRFLKGWFKDTLPTAPIETIGVLRLDGDLYESTMTTLTALYDRVVPGGFVVVDDYRFITACREAIDEFREARGIHDPIVEIDWNAARWRKTV